jgi:hypothetical protein
MLATELRVIYDNIYFFVSQIALVKSHFYPPRHNRLALTQVWVGECLLVRKILMVKFRLLPTLV